MSSLKTDAMKNVGVVFPHQLFEVNPLFEYCSEFILVEENLFFNQYQFHKQKLAFHRASMKEYQSFLETRGYHTRYVEAQSDRSDIRRLIASIHSNNEISLCFIDPVDDWLSQRIESACSEHGVQSRWSPSPGFINTKDDNAYFFKSNKRKFFQTSFYKDQRKRLGVLIDAQQNPIGGRWTYDDQNRLKYPKNKVPPGILFPKTSSAYTEAVDYVNRNYNNNPGEITFDPLYPTTFDQSKASLHQFLKKRFDEFGPYEDAIVSNEIYLHHSVLSPLINAGLLTPQFVIDQALEYANKHDIPINSLEGFVRQIIGWREFIRGIYEVKGRAERTINFWGFNRTIPASFYDGTTGIAPVDITIKKVLATGYCHHIERLMVLGNFMVLCEFDPDEVYRWFMELFIDAYDWVMVPNVYGMSQFADGGLMSTKPYISSSNYLMKMSDYKSGPWRETWDGLFWRFMHVNRDFFLSNPRLGMLVRTFDKMSEEKQKLHLANAQRFLDTL